METPVWLCVDVYSELRFNKPAILAAIVMESWKGLCP